MVENCVICSEFMGQFHNRLDTTAQWSQRPIHDLIETFIPIQLTHYEMLERQICQNCLIKFNELDEHQTAVERIQRELTDIYNNAMDKNLDTKPMVKIEPIDFPSIEEDDFEIEMPQKTKKADKISRTSSLRIKEEKSQIKEKTKKPKKSDGKPRKRKGEDTTGFEVIDVDGVKNYRCEICNKILFRRIQSHRAIHTTERNVECEICGKFFKTRMCLWSHRKRHKPQKKLICDYCGKTYPKKFHLAQHIKSIHLQRKDFTCTICGKGFGREGCLMQHLKRHSDVKNEVCEVCGFRAYTKTAIYRHMKSHTRERKYPCPICGKMFLHSYNVTAHVNHVHKGIGYKPVDEAKLTCGICGKKFPRQNRVRQHMAEVHNHYGPNENNYVVEEVDWEQQAFQQAC